MPSASTRSFNRSLFRAGAAALAGAALIGGVVDAPEASAQTGAVALVVDVSDSMSGTGIREAKAALHKTIDGLSPTQTVSLRSFNGSCNSSGRLLVRAGKNNKDQLRSAVNGLTTGGMTPTPSALKAAYGDLPGGSGTIVLVSDGNSTCGDPCAVARDLKGKNVNFKVHTVGYKLDSSEEEEMRCIARVTGGNFVATQNGDQLAKQLNTAVNSPEDFGKLFADISSLRDDLSSELDADPDADASSQSSRLSSKVTEEETRNKIIGIISGIVALIAVVAPLVAKYIPQVTAMLQRAGIRF